MNKKQTKQNRAQSQKEQQNTQERPPSAQGLSLRLRAHRKLAHSLSRPKYYNNKLLTPHCKLTAVLVAILVIMLPVTLAEQLSIQRFSGQDGIQGFARENDELSITVLAEMPGGPIPEVAVERLRAYYGGTFEFFDKCEPTSNAMYQCEYSTTELVHAGPDEYAIRLYDAENNVVNEKTRVLTVDILKPTITQFTVEPGSARAAQPVTITYAAEDYGRQAGLTQDCAGIKDIIITANDENVATITGDLKQCILSGSFKYTPEIAGKDFELINLCAVATDYLGHQSFPACTKVRFDNRAPSITSLELQDPEGFEVTHVRTGQAARVNVVITILGDEDDVLEESVSADLSSLNPLLGTRNHDFRIGDSYVWQNVDVTQPKNCKVKTSATDELGNNAQKTLTCTLPVDDVGPETTFFGTEFTDDDGTPLLGKKATIIAKLKETGSGMNKANAFINAQQLGLSTQLKADECEKTNNEWTCKWSVTPTVSSGDYEIVLLANTQDDLGNLLGSPKTITVRFDKTPPKQPELVEIIALRNAQRIPTNATFHGETIEFVITSQGFETALADFSQLGRSEETPAEKCVGNKTKKCTFAVTIGVSGPLKTTTTFTFADKAGNKAVLAVPIKVLGIAAEKQPNYWKTMVECSPEQLDRTIMSIYDFPAYCRVRLTSTNPDAKALSVQGPANPQECTGQVEWLSDITTTNTQPGTTEAFIGMTFVTADYSNLETIKIECPLRITTRVGDFVAVNPEQENVTIEIPFYRNPLGTLHDNIDKEILDVKDRVEGTWEVIGSLQELFDTVKKFCQIIQTIAQLLADVEVVLRTTGIAEKALLATGILAQEAKQINNNVARPICIEQNFVDEVWESKWFSWAKPFCDFASCRKGLTESINAVAEKTLGIKSPEADLGKPDWFYDYLTFGVPIFKNELKNLVEYKDTKDPSQYLNVEDSLIYSTIIPPFCIPGMVYNLDKWRQIQCKYGLCLAKDVKEAGIPVRACKDQKSYMQCRFVIGEIFNLIPFIPIINYWINLYKRALFEDPLILVSTIVGKIFDCSTCCKAPELIADCHWACDMTSILSKLGHMIETYRRITENENYFKTKSVSQQWCNEFEEYVKGIEEEGGIAQ